MLLNTLPPLTSLFEEERGSEIALPPGLARLYGRLQFPPHLRRPYVIANFVTTLDGVVALGGPGSSGGGEISDFNAHDHMVMGLLRALADAVIVGAGTLRASPKHLWTAERIYPPLAGEYQALRSDLGKVAAPLNVIVSARGEVDLSLPLFQSAEVEVLVITTTQGLHRIGAQALPATVKVIAAQPEGSLSARTILEAVGTMHQSDLILVEGGPELMGAFFATNCIHELFLTLAPQIAGRDGSCERPGLVAGQLFAPEHPLWGTLIGTKRGGSHLFLRYAFDRTHDSTHPRAGADRAR